MLKILLVEDNLDYRSTLKSALLKRYEDMETRESSDVKEALVIVDTYLPDLIFMDIDLKCDVNGLDLTKIITNIHPEIVVAILSRHDIQEYRYVAQQNCADFFFSKNDSLESIFEYVGSVIENKHKSH